MNCEKDCKNCKIMVSLYILFMDGRDNNLRNRHKVSIDKIKKTKEKLDENHLLFLDSALTQKK